MAVVRASRMQAPSCGHTTSTLPLGVAAIPVPAPRNAAIGSSQRLETVEKPPSSSIVSSVPESLLFEFDLGDECPNSPHVQPIVPARLEALKEELCPYVRPKGVLQAQLLRDVQQLKRQIFREEGQHDTVLLAAKLCGMGYRVTVREGLGGGQHFLSNLRHTFLLVDLGCGEDAEMVIVEPHIRDHFEVASACSSYQEILNNVPAEFVGTRESLFSLIRLLCHEMAHQFEARGMMLPPWRQMKGMLSKWFPANARDTEYEASTPSPSSPTADRSWTSTGQPTRPSHHVCCDNWVPFQYDKHY